MAGRDQRRRSPAERKRIALALRPESLPMLVLAKQKICSSNDRVPAASRHLLANQWNADSTVLLLGFRRSYLPSSTLHHRITHFANVLADLPMSCVVHRLSRAISAFLFFLEKTHSHRIAVPLAHQCDGDF